MRNAAALILTLAFAVPAAAQGKAAATEDDAAIRRLVQQHDAARNRGDWKAVGQLFTVDAEQLTSAGEWRKGRARIEKGMAQSMATVYKNGKYTTTIQNLRMVTPTVAVADGSFEITNIKDGSRRGHMTYVLLKTDDGWRFAASRAMVPTAAGATPGREK